LSALFLAIGWTLVALAAALLLVPLHVTAFGEVEDLEAGGLLTLCWGWGLLEARLVPAGAVEIRVLDHTIRRTTIRAFQRQGPRKERKPGPKLGILVAHRATLREVLRSFATALRLRAKVWGRVGLERPDHTAWLAVVLDELGAAVRGIDVQISPHYIEPAFLVRGVVTALVWPVRLLGAAAELLARRETRQFLHALR